MEVEALKWKDEGRREREPTPPPLTATGGRGRAIATRSIILWGEKECQHEL